MPITTDIAHELATIDLGDQRLNRRACSLLDTLASDPQASINSACHGWSETQGAYRFFHNDLVQPEKILQPHWEATRQRMEEHNVVLLVQDSTNLDYTSHPPEGSGPLTFPNQRGYLDHTQLAITPEGLCLGVADVEIIARSDDDFGNSKKRESDPLETKEVFRWLQGYRRACRVQQQTPGTQIVSVADTEGDLYEIFVEAQQQQQVADFVIRAGKTRSLPELNTDAPGRTYLKLQEEIQKAEVVTIREIELQRTPKREARRTRLEIRAQTMCIKQPHRKGRLPEVELNVVLVREIDPPDEDTAVQWLLVTSLPTDSLDDVLRVVDYYIARWGIEVFFRVLKTGCRVEEIQLETTDRLLPCLMLYKIIAWRVMYLTFLGRECPEMPCDVLFADHEWKSVWRVATEEPFPEVAPRLDHFLLMLAKLGGHNGRRCDGPPGPQAIWVGIRRMTDFALAWLTFGPSET